MRVYSKISGKWGNIPDSMVGDPRYLTEQQVSQLQQAQQPTQPQTIAQGVGKAATSLPSVIGNVAGSLAKPFVNTAQRVGGAGDLLLRELAIKAAQNLNKQGRYDEASKLSKMVVEKGDRTNEKLDQLKDPLQIAKDSLAMLSWGVPTTKASSVFGKAVPALGKATGGGVAGAMSGFGYSPETSAEGLLGSTILGGGTGYALGKIGELRDAKKLSKVQGTQQAEQSGLEKAGLDLKRPVVRPRVGSGPESIVQEDKLIKALSEKGISGTPNEMRRKVATQYKELYSQVGDKLNDTVGSTPRYDVNNIKEYIKTVLSENSKHFVPGDKTFEKLLDRELALIGKKAVDGKVSDKVLHESIGRLNGSLSSAYNKLSGKSSSAITQVEGVRLDVNDALHELLNTARPDLQDLTSEMSLYHKASPGLENAASESFNLFGFPFTGPAQAFMGAQNRVGDVLLKAGGTTAQQAPTQAINTIAPSSGLLQNLLQQVNKTPLINTFAGQQQPTQQSTQGIENPEQMETQTQSPLEMLGLTEQDVQMIAMLPSKTQQAIVTDLIKSKVSGEGKDLTEAQIARKNAGQSVQRAIQLLNSGGIKTGLIQGPLESLKGKAGIADQSTLEFNTLISSLKAQIAKARAGTSFTTNEEALLNRYTPNVGDSYQELQTKLMGLSQVGF